MSDKANAAALDTIEHAHNMRLLGLIRDEPAWALSRLLRLEQLEADIRKHDEATDGYDGSLTEHGPCLVCKVLDE